jgi:Pentapeptide repeats (8 copies)
LGEAPRSKSQACRSCWSNPCEVDAREAILERAHLQYTTLVRAKLIEANLRRATLLGANLTEADLSRADLREADLERTLLVETNLRDADFRKCRVYGISAWDLSLANTKQEDLVITKLGEPEVTVDDIEVAQFIYLLLHKEKIRRVIDTITSKAVLILGRFTPERKPVLDAVRNELRKHGLLPILFDFDKPDSKDLTGTVQTLANMARFIIADLTDPSCIPHELAMVVPSTVVPVQPVLLEGQHEYAMFRDLKRRYHWVLEPYSYVSEEQLIATLNESVIRPAEIKVAELRRPAPTTA